MNISKAPSLTPHFVEKRLLRVCCNTNPIWPRKVGVMSARLTLLFLCEQTEAHSVFISALLAADFHVLLAPDSAYARLLLSSLAVDAIMITHDTVRNNHSAGLELKLAAPGTPLIMCHDGSLGPQAGVDSLCSADLRDETIARAVAIFFRQSMASSRQRRLGVPGSNTYFRLPVLTRQIAV
jgi:hypothetical protein